MTHPHRAESERSHGERIGHILRAHGGGVEDEKDDKKLVREGVHAHERHDHPGEKLTKLRAGGEAEGHAGKRRMDRPGRHKRADGGKVSSVWRKAEDGEGASAGPGKEKDRGPESGRDAAGKEWAATMHAEQKRDVDEYAKERLANGGRAHRARGGKSGHGKASHVNVIVAPGQGPARPVPVPVPAAGMGGPPPMARPLMPPPGAGGPPMAGGPGLPGGMPPGGPMPPRPGMGAPMPMAGGLRKDGGGIKEAGELHPPFRDMVDMHAGSHGGIGRLEKTKDAKRTHNAAVAGD
jgi:hypothetical protein